MGLFWDTPVEINRLYANDNVLPAPQSQSAKFTATHSVKKKMVCINLSRMLIRGEEMEWASRHRYAKPTCSAPCTNRYSSEIPKFYTSNTNTRKFLEMFSAFHKDPNVKSVSQHKGVFHVPYPYYNIPQYPVG